MINNHDPTPSHKILMQSIDGHRLLGCGFIFEELISVRLQVYKIIFFQPFSDMKLPGNCNNNKAIIIIQEMIINFAFFGETLVISVQFLNISIQLSNVKIIPLCSILRFSTSKVTLVFLHLKLYMILQNTLNYLHDFRKLIQNCSRTEIYLRP